MKAKQEEMDGRRGGGTEMKKSGKRIKQRKRENNFLND